LDGHDGYFDDRRDGWPDDLPEGDRPIIAQYVLMNGAVEAARLEGAGAKLRHTCDRRGMTGPDPRVARVMAEAFERALTHFRAGGDLREFEEAYEAELRRDWPSNLPHGPDDEPSRQEV
jgi:hypothetical protein